MPVKKDPLIELTDEQLYAMHDMDDCDFPWDKLHYSCGEEPPKQLEEDMPICCRRKTRGHQKHVAEVARTLNEAGIGCVLWDYAMNWVYGINRRELWPDMVIADEQIDEAAEVLCTRPPPVFKTVERCSSRLPCYLYHYSTYYHGGEALDECSYRAPYIHLHANWDTDPIPIRFWKQSMTLWATQPLSKTLIPSSGAQFKVGNLVQALDPDYADAKALAPDYTVASHPRFRKFRSNRQILNGESGGRYPADLHPVLILTPERALETDLRMNVRYSIPEVDREIELRIYSWLKEMKIGKEGFVDVERLMPGLRFLVEIALQGDITERQLRVACREVLGEPAHNDGYTWNLCEDEKLGESRPWRVDRYDPMLSLKVDGKWNAMAPRREPKKRLGIAIIYQSEAKKHETKKANEEEERKRS